MASCEIEGPLKLKLMQLKGVLDSTNQRIADDYQVFATQTSASASPNGTNNPSLQRHNGTGKEVRSDMVKVMSEIRTLRSVISNPIFERIVDITDSLNKLSCHLNAHPSMGVDDFDIDPNNGDLILAPPTLPMDVVCNASMDDASVSIEQQRQSNYDQRASKLNLNPDYENQDVAKQHQHQMQQLNNVLWENSSEHNNSNNVVKNLDIEQVLIGRSANNPPRTSSNNEQYLSNTSPASGSLGLASNLHLKQENQSLQQQIQQHQHKLNTETLISNAQLQRNSLLSNQHQGSNQSFQTSSPSSQLEGRLYKTNGNLMLNQQMDSFNIVTNISQESLSASSVQEQADLSTEDGAKTFISIGPSDTTEFSSLQSINAQMKPNQNTKSNVQTETTSKRSVRVIVNKLEIGAPMNNDRQVVMNLNQQTENVKQQHGTGSCSPSTSVGSTVRLADDCDSGPASYLSQTNAKNSLPCIKNEGAKTIHEMPPPSTFQHHQTQVQQTQMQQQHNHQTELPSSDDLADESVEMERITVTLTKDENNSLGITIAGYKISGEKISGIFIRRIVPDSPAALSGKIRVLDQIYAVNGQELVNFSNKQAADVLMQTGKVVTLDLVRYKTKSQFDKLQSVLAKAISKQ